MIDDLPVLVLNSLEDAQLNFEALENAELLTGPGNLSGLSDIAVARLNLGIDAGAHVGGVAAGGTALVSHSLGRTPAGISVTTFFNGTPAPNIGWAVQNPDSSGFTVYNPSASASGFFWIAIG